MTYEEYFKDWLPVIDKKELLQVLSVLSKEYKIKNICPDKKDIFKAFELCSLSNLKIIMLGLDPYPQKDVATGILFGNKKEVNEENLSPSLKVVKEAAINFEVPHYCITFDQTLESWAKQGILMLNSALTCELNKVGSHTMLWRSFISKLLINLSVYDTSKIYVLFGRQAQSFSPYINHKYNHIIEIEHPSYFARNNIKMPSQLFIDINNKIVQLYGEYIKWFEEY